MTKFSRGDALADTNLKSDLDIAEAPKDESVESAKKQSPQAFRADPQLSPMLGMKMQPLICIWLGQKGALHILNNE